MVDETQAPTSNPLVEALRAAFDQSHEGAIHRAGEHADKRLTDWLEAFEAEHADFMRPFIAGIVDNPSTPQVVRDALSSVSGPQHQTQVILGLFSVGRIVGGFVDAGLQPFVQDVANAVWSAHPSLPLSPQEAALAVIRGHVDQGAAQAEAELSGVDAHRFGVMVQNTGTSPGPMMLAEALRRGIIDEGRFAEGIKQGDVRNEWIATLAALRYGPPGVGEVLAGAIQGHLDVGVARELINEAGIDPKHFAWMLETAGRPPGTVELLHLMNRGEISGAEVAQAIRESDVKNKYIPALMKLARVIPPMRTVVSAIRQGVLTPSAGLAKLMQLGYNHEDAAMLVSEATATKHQNTRDLTEAQIVSLYREHLITRADATTLLGKLKFDAQEIGWLLSLADHDRHARAQTAAIARVHNRYVAHHLTKIAASAALDSIGVDPAGRDDLLTLWTEERGANVATLSVAQCQKAHKSGLITESDLRTRLHNLGYAPVDVDILVAEVGPTKQPKP